jgi:hypothetical protein
MYMKNILTSLFVVSALTLSAQHEGHDHAGHDHDKATATPSANKPNPNAPKIKLADEVYDFGTIVEGPAASHDFSFKNEGKEPLILSNVKASCGCTVPTWPKEPILPGKESKITATYNTQGRPGPFTKTITIESNASEPSKVVTIKGQVIKAEEDKSIPYASPSILSPKN